MLKFLPREILALALVLVYLNVLLVGEALLIKLIYQEVVKRT